MTFFRSSAFIYIKKAGISLFFIYHMNNITEIVLSFFFFEKVTQLTTCGKFYTSPRIQQRKLNARTQQKVTQLMTCGKFYTSPRIKQCKLNARTQ